MYNTFKYEITKHQILSAAKKSKIVGRTYEPNGEHKCDNCFFHNLIDEAGGFSDILCKCTYIRDYLTKFYKVDFEHIGHCGGEETMAVKHVLSKLQSDRAIRI